MCKVFHWISKKRNCFLEFHDERKLTPKMPADETVLAVNPINEIAVQNVKKDHLKLFSPWFDDSAFDLNDTDVRDGLFL
jgi:hypothetical protein